MPKLRCIYARPTAATCCFKGLNCIRSRQIAIKSPFQHQHTPFLTSVRVYHSPAAQESHGHVQQQQRVSITHQQSFTPCRMFKMHMFMHDLLWKLDRGNWKLGRRLLLWVWDSWPGWVIFQRSNNKQGFHAATCQKYKGAMTYLMTDVSNSCVSACYGCCFLAAASWVHS